ncbi:hypothetical protein LOTGIDRAFT_170324 [Lottia gigantea]|uniref:MADF domain-containing protein n=1 Tax=Lottia gigantea TaxID=225164 RepID=V3ZIB1_LOTGI|nr:hypothetical protein LOTGIDRAFT_170324 [Lottia gigantea]ESO82050.1 hypothetical protein LOTGIDRAFT_170324 [Lottia gigantea]
MPKASTKERRSSPHKRAENDAEQGDNDLNELLILEIEKNPILYDKTRADYKRIDFKEVVWSSIGRHIRIEVNEVKEKWKSNRDAFVRCRQKSKTKSGQKAKEVKPYKYAHLLEFLIPTGGERQTSGNLRATPEAEIYFV